LINQNSFIQSQLTYIEICGTMEDIQAVDRHRNKKEKLLINGSDGYLFTFSKNVVISSVRKRYCALGLGMGVVEIRFRSNVFSSKCSRSDRIYSLKLTVFRAVLILLKT